jgi:hypothetical protein
MGLKQLLIDADSSQFIQSTGKPFEQRDIPYGEGYQLFQNPSSPLIVKRFQKNNNRILPGVEQETNSTVGLVNQVTDSFIRGGVITATQRALVDTERIGKFLLTPSGLSWIAANVALQRTNPENVTSPRNRQFTPLNIGLQVPANIAGIHFRRDGIVDFDFENGYNYDASLGGRKYESSLKSLNDPEQPLYTLFDSKILGLGNSFLNDPNVLKEYDGGAHSVFGIGQTRIKRYTPFVIDDPTTGFVHPNAAGFRTLEELGRTTPPDFREIKGLESSTDYSTYNLETNFGIGNPGNPALKNQPYNSVYNAGTVDRINITDIFRRSDLEEPSQLLKDLIKFRIAVVDTENPLNDNVMLFRAFLTNFSDGYTGNWDSFKYNGRAENFYIYNGFDRKISFDFKIAAQSRYEMIPLYRKLNYLVAQTAPEYKNRRMRGVFSRLTIGDWCNELPGFFTSINLSVDTSTPWEIRLDSEKDADMNELPMVVNVSCNFTPVHNFAPENRIDSPFILPEIGVDNGRKWHTLNNGVAFENKDLASQGPSAYIPLDTSETQTNSEDTPPSPEITQVTPELIDNLA